MNKQHFSILAVSILAIIIIACGHSKSTVKTADESSKATAQSAKSAHNKTTGPPMIIYRTSKDYSQNVPVTLSDDGTKIISYPAPSDLKINGNFVYPTSLGNGYGLDNRGLNEHTAFLDMTYEDYSNAPEAMLNPIELYNRVIDKRPFVKIYTCNLRSSYGDSLVKKATQLVISGDLMKVCKCNNESH